jgi:hypothetical protein
LASSSKVRLVLIDHFRLAVSRIDGWSKNTTVFFDFLDGAPEDLTDALSCSDSFNFIFAKHQRWEPRFEVQFCLAAHFREKVNLTGLLIQSIENLGATVYLY